MIAGLRWGLKASFVGYLLGLEDGAVIASDGASFGPDRVLAFPLADGTGFDAGTLRGRIAFSGAVAFVGHAGLLDVRLAGLQLDCGDDSVLSARVDGSRVALAVVELGVPDVDGDDHRWTQAPARLTRAGAALLNDVYRAGAALDGLDLVLPRAT